MRKVYRLLIMVSAVFFGLGISINSYATDGTTETGTIDELIEQAHQIKVDSDDWNGWPQGPQTEGRSAIVMEADTGTILYAKGIDERQYPASITKILTALVALENGDLNDEITVSADAIGCLLPYYANIGLKEGNIISLKDALYATLLASANEAAYTVGEGVGVSAGYDYSWFINKMNEKCKEIGADNSHFVNANGMPDEKHYTTARDMALIAKELYDYPEFFEIAKTLSYKIEADENMEEHVFQQSDKMLIPESEEYYEYATAGKTGYTEESRSTLVTTAEKDGMKLICVVLHTYGSNSYNNTKTLFDYAFNNFEKVSINDLGDNVYIKSYDSDDAYAVLPKGFDTSRLKSEIDFNEKSADKAVITYYNGENEIGHADISVTESYIEEKSVKTEVVISQEKKEKEEKKKTTGLVYIVVAVLFATVLLTRMVGSKRKRKKSRRRHSIRKK